ncbi:hypothetical protein E1B28_000293 [Marasmius oreades]|uniref:Xylanolytic transcriptional activator regulatory domain-containing protein n=1 Tax=Marasmius oreades TaxID=181124 RepID=A0A9P7V157_9AGAR|nr:uncharacterized protein E1B28_000293 [Marasmius oreades]KAG7098332.1 hypothetical protein E1B28_000293 [Marasmius oreades]
MVVIFVPVSSSSQIPHSRTCHLALQSLLKTLKGHVNAYRGPAMFADGESSRRIQEEGLEAHSDCNIQEENQVRQFNQSGSPLYALYFLQPAMHAPTSCEEERPEELVRSILSRILSSSNSNTRRYVALLESRVKKLENTLSKTDNSLSNLVTSKPSTPINHGSPETLSDVSSSAKADDEDLSHLLLSDQMQKLSIHTMRRFFGPSSGFAFIQSVHGVRKEVTGEDAFQSVKRSEFWQVAPWELATAERERPSYIFPDDSLMASLTSLYFEKVNVFFPILHAPTFKRNINEGLHLENPHFGAVVLVVCAIASRCSNDKRVLSSPDQPLSAGWKWFEQVQLIRRSLFDPPSSHELQFYALAFLYVVGTSSPGGAWYMIGLGIRCAVDMGAHRRKPEGYKPTVEDEQRKRAFWVLFVFDRLISGTFVGRPFAIHQDDFDAELPIECDDEYWETADPELAFKQPSDKASYISSFVALVRLTEILSFSVKSLFSFTKLQPRDQVAEQQAVTEVDSALNDWKSRLSQHLHWDSNRERGVFFEQSGLLHIYYHIVQIQTHRRFVQQSSPFSLSSLAICTIAAKSCTHIIDTLASVDTPAISFVILSGFTAGCLLLSNIWASKRAGIKIDVKKAMIDVEKLKRAFQTYETRVFTAGRLTDFLTGLSRGLEDNGTSTQSPVPVDTSASGRQRRGNGCHVEPTQIPPNLDGDLGYQTATNNLAYDQTQNMDPMHQIFGDGTDTMPNFPQPAFPPEMSYGQNSQTEYRGDGTTQDFDMDVWSMPQWFPFEGWNDYAANMASLDLDTFMQSNPDLYM